MAYKSRYKGSQIDDVVKSIIATPGEKGQIFTSNGSDGLPSWGNKNIAVYTATMVFQEEFSSGSFTLSDGKKFDDISKDIQDGKVPILYIKKLDSEPGEYEYYCMTLEYYYFIPNAQQTDWNEITFTTIDVDSFNILRATLSRDQSQTVGVLDIKSIQPALSSGNGINIDLGTSEISNTGVLGIGGKNGAITLGNGLAISNNNEMRSFVSYVTEAPTTANTDGGLKFAILDTEPAVKYDGWVYLI